MMRKIYSIILLCCFILPSIGTADIVKTDEVYSYERLIEDLVELSESHPDLITYKPLATTEYGRKVWAIKLGYGETTLLLNGSHHAREWMTSALLMKMIETYADAYETNKTVGAFNPNILNDVSIWFVPMVNPDGVTLQQFGLYAFPTYIHSSLVEMNKGSLNFKRWKANLQGIDLNRQYPANWDDLKGINKTPSYQFYKGTAPLEAVEIKALANFTYEIQPEIAVSYHSSGNVLFWGYHHFGVTHTTDFTRDYHSIAEKVSEMTSYQLEEPASHQQGGGYTDWFVEEFKRPALTVEIGSLIEENSLPLRAFPTIWERNKSIGLFLANKAFERKDEAAN